MDGFKNTTKTQYSTTAGRRFARGGMTVSRNDMAGGEGPMNKPAMVAKYAKGGSVKKAYGGYMDGSSPEAADVLMSRMTKDELAQGAKGVKMAQERLERKSVKRGVPPSSDKPMISQRMKDVGKSIGVVKKAGGGEVSRQAPSATSNPANYTGGPTQVARAKTPVAPRSPKPSGPKFGMYMSGIPLQKSNAPKPQNMGGNTTLGRNKGGVVKKAAGGLTLGNKTVNLPSTGSSLLQPVKLPSNLAPHSQRLTLGTGGLKDGQSITNSKPTLTLGTGGLRDGQSITNSKPKLTLGTNRVVDTGNGLRAYSGPITLGSGGLKPGQSITNSKPTGMKKGGLSAMPKGKGCK